MTANALGFRVCCCPICVRQARDGLIALAVLLFLAIVGHGCGRRPAPALAGLYVFTLDGGVGWNGDLVLRQDRQGDLLGSFVMEDDSRQLSTAGGVSGTVQESGRVDMQWAVSGYRPWNVLAHADEHEIDGSAEGSGMYHAGFTAQRVGRPTAVLQDRMNPREGGGDEGTAPPDFFAADGGR